MAEVFILQRLHSLEASGLQLMSVNAHTPNR